MHGDLADGMPGPHHEQHRPRPPVQDDVALQHRLGIGGHEVPPLFGPGARRVGDRDPAPGRAGVGEHVQPAVPAHPDPGPRVGADLDRLQRGRGQVGGGQVGDPQVVAGLGAPGRADRQPPAVPAHRGRVVRRLVPARAEDQHVVVGGGAHPVQVDPAVILLFAYRHLIGGQPARVVERLAPRQPGDPGVAAPVDRAVHQLAGFHVHHPQQRLLAAAFGQLVGQPPALLVRLPAVEGGPPARVDGHRVDERPPGAGIGGVPGAGIHRAQHRVFFTGQPPGEEPPGAPPHRDPDVPGPRQLPDPVGQGRHPRQGRRMRPEQFVLGAQPGSRLVTAGVLEPPVGVADPVAQQILGQVEPPRGRVLARVLVCGHDWHHSGPPL